MPLLPELKLLDVVSSRSQSNVNVPTSATNPENFKNAPEPVEANAVAKDGSTKTLPPTSAQPQPHRLFGIYMNSVVTYQDGDTAWLSSEGVLSWVTSSVYETLGGGGFRSGIKLTRGFAAPGKPKDTGDKPATVGAENAPKLDEKQQRLLKRRSAPPTTDRVPETRSSAQQPSQVADNPHTRLQRQLSSLMETESRNSAEADEQIRRREEQVIQDDYNAQAGETQEREIEHLILVTHGIGQLLGLRCVLSAKCAGVAIYSPRSTGWKASILFMT